MKKTINKIIVDFMEYLGIRYCFGVPGSNMGLLEEIDKSKKISLILTKHEEGASFMASGFSKSSGLPSCCFGSVGPGATNLTTGVAAAYYDSQPVLVLSGQIDSSFQGKMGFQESTGKGRTISQFKLFKEITKYAYKLSNEKDIPKILKETYFALNNSRPGPAYIEIPTDIMEKKIKFSNEMFKSFTLENKKRLKRNIVKEKIKNIAIELANSRKPAILLGAGAIPHKKEIIRFINKSKIPVLTTLKGRGILSDESSFSLGSIGLTGQNSANEYIKDADFLIVIGASLGQFTTKNWSLNLNKTKIARFDVLTNDLTKNYRKDYLLLGDISKNVAFLNSVYKTNKGFRDLVIKYRKKGYFDYPEMSENSLPLKPQAFFSELRKILPKDSIICSESIAWTQKYFKIFYPRTNIVCTGLAPVGCSLSEALGSKLANKDKVVVSIQGDGGFQMTAMELMTSINNHIPIISIVLNNGILGPIYNSQIKKYHRAFMSRFKNPDFAKFARSFGIGYEKITNKEEISPKMNNALNKVKKGTSVLVEVIINNEKWP